MAKDGKDKPWEQNVIPGTQDKPSLKPRPVNLGQALGIKPGRPQIIDLSGVVQFRPRPTPPPLRIPFLISRDELEKRRKVLMQWSVTAQLKI